MERLEVRLLGRFDVRRDGTEVEQLGSDTAKALLALLASEPGRVWSRPAVAELLWPERRPGGALGNLRHTLTVLRRALAGTDGLVAGRTTISFEASEHTWVDLVEFEALVAVSPKAPDSLAAWKRGVGLWRGEFLEGLQPVASPEWEEWQLLTAERCRRNLAKALWQIADRHERSGEWNEVIATARRIVAIDRWDEGAHRLLMQALTSRGDRALAVAHYSELVQHLEDEVGTTPSSQTAALAAQIQSDGSSRDAVPAALPSEWLRQASELATGSIVVGREKELGALQAHLAGVGAGRGRFVLIAGEAGSGKTTLAAEFMRRVRHVRTVAGRCNAMGEMGDPYLPFRESLSLLGGDVEAGLKTGALTPEQATALWEGMPRVGKLIETHGPHLPGVMIDGPSLAHRLARVVPDATWLSALRRHPGMETAAPAGRTQPALFDEYTAVLSRAADGAPVVMVIDDLHWADAGSVALLWHLVRRLDRLSILLVGTYRPEELTDPDAASPAWASLLPEITVEADLAIELSTDRPFVDALLDAEPNHLDDAFRQRLIALTGGHPLFTVELLRGMQERGELVRDPAGAWQQQDSLSWDAIPHRLEAAIARRIAALPDDLVADLTVAAIQGDQFLADVVAKLRHDSSALVRLGRHAQSAGTIIQSRGVDRLQGGVATHYRFRHSLFQHYLYHTMDLAERVQLHESTGRALEELYSSHPNPPVVDLAYHFDRARLPDPAIGYLEQAATRARTMAAEEEAIRLLERAHLVLDQLPVSPIRDERELKLLVDLAAAINIARGWGTPEARAVSNRILELIDGVDPSIATTVALIRLAGTHKVSGRFDQAEPWQGKALEMAEAIGDHTLLSVAASDGGHNRFHVGELDAGHQLLVAAYETAHTLEPAIIDAYGFEPVSQSLAFDSNVVDALGYPDQAYALAERADAASRRSDHAFTRCLVLVDLASAREDRGDHDGMIKAIEELEQILAEHHFPYWEAWTAELRGRLASMHGDRNTGIRLIEDALTQFDAMGFRAWLWDPTRRLAEILHKVGETDRAVRVVRDAKQKADPSGDPIAVAGLTLQHGRLLRLQGDEAAEAELLHALSAAAAMGHRRFELEAATELGLLYETEGRNAAAIEVLAPQYEWFSEGFDTLLLTRAREILDRLDYQFADQT